MRVRAALADHLAGTGDHEGAADAYRSILKGMGEKDEEEREDDDGVGGGDRGMSRLECAAALVRELSYFDPEGAAGAAREELPELTATDATLDAEELEAMPTPRIVKGIRTGRTATTTTTTTGGGGGVDT